jgi:hypothetical protein
VVALKKLDKKEWKRLKKDADIKSNPWWKKADAAVGSAIDKYQTAREKWHSNKSLETFSKYMGALGDLDKTFGKFLDKKDLTKNTASKDLQSDIEAWRQEITSKLAALARKYPLEKLQELDEASLNRVIDQFVLD